MKLEAQYLKGAIDMVISNYEEGVRVIPKSAGLKYEFEFGAISQEGILSAKITFKWVEYSESRLVSMSDHDHEAEYETPQTEMDDYFTILGGEDIGKLREYVEEVLEKITIAN